MPAIEPEKARMCCQTSIVSIWYSNTNFISKDETPFIGIRVKVYITNQDKARIVAETLKPGVTMGDVAGRHGICYETICAWRRSYKRGLLVPDDTPIKPLSDIWLGEDLHRLVDGLNTRIQWGVFRMGEPPTFEEVLKHPKHFTNYTFQ